MKKVLDQVQVRELEQKAVDEGIGYLQLMENAGKGIARFLAKKVSVSGKRIAVLCGKGNNGGDGFVAALALAERGAKVVVVLVQGFPSTEISVEVFGRLKDTTVRICQYEKEPEYVQSYLTSCDYVIDAIYGIGFRGTVPEMIADVIRAANHARATVIAVDIPSGVFCDTGEVLGDCIQADYTVTFSTLKPAHLLFPGKAFCGEVTIAPVGIPGDFIEEQKGNFEVLDDEYCRKLFTPRKEDGNKGDYGSLLCLCGSYGMAGAAIMAASAALRCGVGLVHMVLPERIYPLVASCLAEPIFTVLPENENLQSLPEVIWQKTTACLIGCGLGLSDYSKKYIFQLMSNAKVPIILDADGLNTVAENIDIIKTVKAPLILTPHPGEMARLMKTTVQDVQSHRLEYVRRFSRETGAVVVLKGSGTLIAAPDGKVCYNPTGNPGMARGGSGDILAGMIGAFVAQGVDPFYAASCGVYLHGLAGDRCAEHLSQMGMLPTDIIKELPELFLHFENVR